MRIRRAGAHDLVVVGRMRLAFLADHRGVEQRQQAGNLHVEPGHRGRGVGRARFEACVGSAAGTGLRRLFLHATDSGRPLYEEAGFRRNDDWMELRPEG